MIQSTYLTTCHSYDSNGPPRWPNDHISWYWEVC